MDFGCSSYTDSSFILIFCSILTLLVFLARRRHRRFPPGPIGLPLVGNIPFVIQNPPKKLRDLSRKYGNVMSVQLGMNDVVVLSGYKTIHQVGKDL